MANEFIVKNGLISLNTIQAASLSGQPNTLLMVDNEGKIFNTSLTPSSITGTFTNIQNDLTYLGSISGDWARKSLSNIFTQPNIFTSDVEIGGSLTVAGSATFVNTETILVKDNILELNSSLSGTPPSFLNAGIKVNRGDFEDYYFMWRESDTTFRIGTISGADEPALSGSGDTTQAVATREDNPIDTGLAVWNDSLRRFDTEIALEMWTTVPATPTSTGYKGQRAYSSGYLYECISDNTWVRRPMETLW